MRVSVLGTGYVGLVAGACLSDSGNHVHCIDVDESKIRKLEKGEIPIYEPGLEELVVRNHKAGRLTFGTSSRDGVKDREIVFLAVGTPQDEDGSSDLTYLFGAVKEIRDQIAEGTVVVIKSTAPVGTADEVRKLFREVGREVEVVSNPEFLKEGTAVNDFLRPERVILGTSSERARTIMGDLYAPFVRGGNPILFMSNRSAELAKYAANTFLAMKISFINEMANLAEKLDADIHDVRRGLVTDSRIGNKFLYPGCGYGGSCFPKDVQALIHLGDQIGFPLDMFRQVHSINEKQKQVLFQKIRKHFRGEVKGRTIALWGLSFKPMTDDMREAPSVALIEALLEAGASVKAFDPVAMHEAKRIFPGRITLVDDAYAAIKGADALAILTEWNEFRSPDFAQLKKELSRPVVFDGRNLYSPESMERLGFTYFCIGKPDPK